jgi:uncharacterized protein with HEPN domain
MRPERLYLNDILEAIRDIEQIVGGRDLNDVLGDVAARRGVLHALMVIGEAVARIPTDFRDRYPETPWRRIVGFRNVVVHEYFALDWAIVWEALTVDLPVLQQQVEQIVQREFQGDGHGSA